MPFTISLRAYSKIILHCCKYPHKAVNGVVIGSVSKKDQSVQIQDAIPLFHLGLGLAPMLEVALTQVEIYCGTKGLSIVGYYHANEREDDISPSDTALHIAAKIVSNCEKACLLMVDNQNVTSDEQIALRLLTRMESGKEWREHKKEFSLVGGELALRTTKRLVQNRMFEHLVDFDSHLDNIQLDWTNLDISRAIDAQPDNNSDD